MFVPVCMNKVTKIIEWFKGSSTKYYKNTMEGATERQLEIADLVSQEKTQKEIADILCISPLTVRTHVTNLMRVWGVVSSVGIAVKYVSLKGNLMASCIAIAFATVQLGICLEPFEIDYRQARKVNRVHRVRMGRKSNSLWTA